MSQTEWSMTIEDYSDIIDLPYQGKKEGGMSMYQRAAQFAPFAALTGHGAAINETARLTEQPIELSDDERGVLDERLAHLLELIHEHPTTTITYFIPDTRKEGGSYTTYSGRVKKWDEFQGILTFEDGRDIPVCRIIELNIQR